jgi:flagellar hook-associated protein 3 FlgL
MQISTSTLYDRAIARMGDLNTRASRLSDDISSTKHLNVASDDSVAFQRVTLVKRAIANEAQYADNVGLASSLLTQSDDALATMQTQVQRAQELAIRASTGTLSDADRQTIATELDGIVETMMGLANSTDARGQPLFGGADGGTPYAKDADGTIRFQGSGQPAAIPISATGTIVASDSGGRIFGGIATPDGQQDMFAIVQGLATALANGDAATLAEDIANGLTGINAAGEQIANARASVGARGARLTIEAEQYETLSTAREVERSGLEDTDIEASYIKLQQMLTALQATQSTFSQLSQLSLFDQLR